VLLASLCLQGVLAVESSKKLPAWMKDLQDQARFLKAVHDQQDLGSVLGSSNLHAKAAATAAEAEMRLLANQQAIAQQGKVQNLGESSDEDMIPAPVESSDQDVIPAPVESAPAAGTPEAHDAQMHAEMTAHGKVTEAPEAPEPASAGGSGSGSSVPSTQNEFISSASPTNNSTSDGSSAALTGKQSATGRGNDLVSDSTRGKHKGKLNSMHGSTDDVRGNISRNHIDTNRSHYADGDKPQYPNPPALHKPPSGDQPSYDSAPRPPRPKMVKRAQVPEDFEERQKPQISGTSISPNVNSFLYYGRMISLQSFPTEQFEDHKYLKVDDQDKLVIDTIAQDSDHRRMSFKIVRALAYTGSEAFGQKPFCYSLQPAHSPAKRVIAVSDTFFAIETILPSASLQVKRAASFCVMDKKAGENVNMAISLSKWGDVDSVWRAVGKFVSLGAFVSTRSNDFTPESATFIVHPALFHGLCWRGAHHEQQCKCEKGYYDIDCHPIECKDQKRKGMPQCSDKGICQPKLGTCSCAPGSFGSDCHLKACPSWGPDKALRTCNHRGQCDGLTGLCKCDAGWSGNACENGFCPTERGVSAPCSRNGVCDTSTGVCTCGKDHWGRSCQKKKCASFYPDCSGFGKCQRSGQDEGRCICSSGGSGNACQYKSCPIKDCNGHGFCDRQLGQCKCYADWFGAGCTDRNCANGCSGHGTCAWKTGQCACAKGWGLADCSERNCPGLKGESCSGHGRCDPTNGKCTCLGHTWGETCEKKCPGRCSEHGRCDQRSGKCVCSGSYFGEKCEHDACPNNCNGQGQCDLKRGKCQCSPGFVGEDCGVKRCPRDCNGNGKCTGTSESSRCQCQYPFIGELCKLRKCPADCSNNGLCNMITGKCKCVDGYVGSDCAHRKCPKDCLKRGECVHGECKCYKPFKGQACEYADCPVKCGKHGSCDNYSGKCKCVGLWTGIQCNQKKCPNDCNGHGTCSSKGECRCEMGWKQEDCSEHKCDKPCVHGVCDRSTGMCKCNSGYFTKDCSKKLCTGDDVTCNEKSCQCGIKGVAQSQCNYREGKCECKPGLPLAKFFFSSYCAKRKCPGFCDERTQKCDCSGHGACDYKKGECKCVGGYTGNNCAFHIVVQDGSDNRMKYLNTAADFSMNGDLRDQSAAVASIAEDSEVMDLHGEAMGR